MTPQELVQKIVEFAREGRTGNRYETPWALLPHDCKFRQNGGENNDTLIKAELNHPDIKEEDIQGAFVRLENIIESEPEAVANGFKKLIDVILTQSVCDRTITDELLSNYEHFCKTIVRNLAVEGGQYVDEQDFKDLLEYIYKDNPYQSIKHGRIWHNSHQAHIHNMRIVGNAKSHDAQLGFLNDENHNHHFLQFELTALVLLVFDLTNGQGLRFIAQNQQQEVEPDPQTNPTEPQEPASLEQQAHDKYIDAIYSLAISGNSGAEKKKPWQILSKEWKDETPNFGRWDYSKYITVQDISASYWNLVDIIKNGNSSQVKDFKEFLNILVNQSVCETNDINSCLGTNFESFCFEVVKKYTIDGEEYLTGENETKRLEFAECMYQAYNGNRYCNTRSRSSHQAHIRNMRLARNIVAHSSSKEFKSDTQNNHLLLQEELKALVLLAFDLSKGDKIKLHAPKKKESEGSIKPDGQSAEMKVIEEQVQVQKETIRALTLVLQKGGQVILNPTSEEKKDLEETHTNPGGTESPMGETVTDKASNLLGKLKTINRKTWVIIASVAVIILATAIAVPIMIPDNKVVEEPVVQNSREHILEAIAGLEGYYYLRETNGDKPIGSIRTCQVKKFEGNTARILITSDYDPEVYEFTYNEDGTLYSREMGSGNLTYNKKLDKRVLTFKKDNTIWKFTK